jgi:hypothetical protein
MGLLWMVLAVIAVDVAALLAAADTRPGFDRDARWWHRYRRRVTG